MPERKKPAQKAGVTKRRRSGSFRLCQQYDCEICIRGLPFNPNDPASILQLDQLAAFAEFESRTTSKRVKGKLPFCDADFRQIKQPLPAVGF